MLCPRRCGADRKNGKTGICRETEELRALLARLEEPERLTGWREGRAVPQEPEALRRKSAELLESAEAALIPLRDQQFSQRRRTEQLLELLPEVIRWNGSPHEDGSPRNTAWDALVGEGANQEGLALAFRLLCDQLNLECAVIQGSWNGAPPFWKTLHLNGEAWFVDLTLEDYAHLRTGEELALLGYDWSGRPEVSPASGGGVGEIARNLKNNT